MTSGYMRPVSEADRQAARYMGELLDGGRLRVDGSVLFGVATARCARADTGL